MVSSVEGLAREKLGAGEQGSREEAARASSWALIGRVGIGLEGHARQGWCSYPSARPRRMAREPAPYCFHGVSRTSEAGQEWEGEAWGKSWGLQGPGVTLVDPKTTSSEKLRP